MPQTEWARNQRYKLYANGRLFDIGKDELEKKPISDPTPDEVRILDSPRNVLARFKGARPKEVADAATRIKPKK